MKKNNDILPARQKKQPAKKAHIDRAPEKSFPIAAFGASAGGLEAFIAVLKHLDANLGMAYVLIMHLSPNHKSALTEILQAKTRMQVHTVKDGMEVMANNIYVIPPNTFMSVVDGHLKLAPRLLTSIGNYAVDYFFTALASSYKNNAIGVILSGTATDGTLGLKAIKAEGGITFAQDDTAKFSGMPAHAYEAGYVDFMLPPEEIAKELMRLVKTPYTVLPADKIEVNQVKEADDHTEQLKKILLIVKNKTGVDFFLHYKQASVYRRIMRRMVLNKFDSLTDYCSMLKTQPEEVDALYDDFLINVTSFFRDPDFYKILVKKVFPSIMKKGKSTAPIRIWVAGCASGEEAYSVAICLMEFLEKKESTVHIQIFASDLDANAIEKARLGIYPASALQDVSQHRLTQYFKKIDGYYQIAKSVREICIFSQQNLLRDPPFSKIDLISCQNVLIYLESNPQKKILQTFHYALKPGGYLFLGKSETVGSENDLFEPLDKKIRLYLRKQTNLTPLEFTIHKQRDTSQKGDHPTAQYADLDVEKEMDKLVLSRFVHPCIVLNQGLMIIQFFGETSPYLAPVTGKASLNVLKMIRDDLVIDLRSLLQQARKTEKIAVKEGIRIYNKKVLQELTVEVVPKKISRNIFFLVVFMENVVAQLSNRDKTKSNGNTEPKEKTIRKLENELTQSREIIRTTSEEYESTYEELQANNEEILSSNEELQSVNEELETSKEELQSANEELTTINEELRTRNVELKESQNYAAAIVDTMQNPLLVLTANLKVRMANKAFYQTFKLIQEETEGSFIYELSENAWEIPALRGHLNELLLKKSNFANFELKHFFPGLGELVLDVHAYRLMKDSDTKEPLLLLAFNNLSDLVQANKELRKANEQLTEFTFVTSHDLQEPLRKIQTFSDLLSGPEAGLNDHAKKYTQKINASAARMSALLKDLMSFAILLKGDEKKMVTVDLNDTLIHIIKDFELTIERKNAVINVSVLPVIDAEPVHMNLLFYNLISNALKFTKENPVINITSKKVTTEDVVTLKLSTEKQYVAVSVNDNGIGFSQEYVPKMFALFQRLTDKQNVEGTGLGLTVCKRIVEDHGGAIVAEGKPGEGATFTVFLPIR